MPASVHSHAAQRHRPELYAGSRRRFNGIGTIVAGFVALVLVLSAMLTAELGSYGTDSTRSAPTGVQSIGGAAPQRSVSLAPPQSGASATPAPTASGPISDAVAAAVNQELGTLHCAPVKVDPRLVANAQSHSVQMINSGYYALVSQGGTGPQRRAKAARYHGKVLESIVLGAETAVQATRLGFPPSTAAGRTVPATVRVIARNTLTCGWKAVGAQFSRNSHGIGVWSIVLGR